ncbi:GerAB/ArcD/ProY family transporter [Neobacillus sp. LXY-1]|uniref:GerAB/ArcD/ProY family transporter n=1 Tax=Neobacillus sp. LXY-1 TaxID=3379133 RepID=UPI003EE1A35D
MRQKISNLQLMLLVANFIFTSTIISLPQIMVQIGEQNTWMIPIILFPVFLFLTFLIFGKKLHVNRLSQMFLIGQQSKVLEKGFVLIFIAFASILFLRDLRGVIDFIAAVLLPNTPIDMIMVLSVFVLVYVSMAGIEVISRINAVHFGILFVIILLLPLLLLNEWQIGNFQPLPHFKTVTSLIKSSFFTFAWMGEMVLFILVIANVNPVGAARKAVISGTALGLFMFLIILILDISVLGVKLVSEAAYPSYILIQQINITDFLDRIDLLVVAVWVPTFFAKAAYLLYAINYCTSFLYKSNTNKFLFPIGLILGYLSILLFKNSMNHLHFSFYTWTSLGLFLEVIIIVLYIVIRIRHKDVKEPLHS